MFPLYHPSRYLILLRDIYVVVIPVIVVVVFVTPLLGVSVVIILIVVTLFMIIIVIIILVVKIANIFSIMTLNYRYQGTCGISLIADTILGL